MTAVGDARKRRQEAADQSTQEAPGVGLSEEEQSWREEAVECVAGDFAMSNGPESERRTLVLLNRLDAERARVAEVQRERSALDADIERMHGAHERTKQSLRRMEQRAERAQSDLADLRAGVARFIRHGESVPADVTTYERQVVHDELRDLIDERQGGDDE